MTAAELSNKASGTFFQGGLVGLPLVRNMRLGFLFNTSAFFDTLQRISAFQRRATQRHHYPV